MSFHPRSRFTPPYFEVRGQNMGYGIPPDGRFPPPARGFPGQFQGSRWPRQGSEHGMGGPRGRDFAPGGRDFAPRGRDFAPRGRGFVSRGQDVAPRGQDIAPRGRGFAPRDHVPRPRFDKLVKVKEEPPSDYKDKESKPKEKSDDAYLKEEKMHQSNDTTMPKIKLEEGALIVKLDEYNCDLHFNSDESGLIGWTLHTDGFECLWGGARATYGVMKGKVAFEVNLLEALPVQVPETERNPHVLRVGWSVDGADLQLGEDHLSYGYGGTGKVSVNSKFSDYGRPFFVGDVITCCLDLDAKPCSIFYLLNGEYLGVAFKIGSELGGKALYPHITVKNMRFQVNFGGQWPKHPITSGFAMLQNAPSENLVRAQEGPASQKDAEVIMMVGLPSCGKTFWAERYCKDNPDKRFYMLGTNNIIDKMRIFGLTRKRNYHGRWDALIKQATGCLNKWIKIAERRVHNYIIDQTNVYFTARRRKMNSFRGYKRTAVVVVNEPSVLADRSEKVVREEGKVVPESAVMEMKANFSLPEVGESFDEVRYVEVKPPKATELVRALVNEGQAFKRGGGVPNERSEPRGKMPRLDSQPRYGESSHSIGGFKSKGTFDSTRRPNDDEHTLSRYQHSSSSSLSSRNDFNTKEASYDRNRDKKEPIRGAQDRTYQNWHGEQRGNSGSYNDRLPLSNDNTRFDGGRVKQEPSYAMQGYRGFDERGPHHRNWKSDHQMERKVENRNYPGTDMHGRGPIGAFPGGSNANFDNGEQHSYYSSKGDFASSNQQSNTSYSYPSKSFSKEEQGSSSYRVDGNEMGQTYGAKRAADTREGYWSSYSNDPNSRPMINPNEQMGYGVKHESYTRGQQQPHQYQQQQNFSEQSTVQRQGTSTQGYPTNDSPLYQTGSVPYQQRAAESSGQGFDLGWAGVYSGQQASNQTYSEHSHQHQQERQQRPSSYF